MIMHICTNELNRKVYHVDMRTGNIWYDGIKPSGNWKFLGFSHIRKHDFISLSSLLKNPSTIKESPFWYKNGKSQYRVRDLDHGTVREWGSRVVSVTFSESTT